MTAPRILAARMSENELQESVRDLCRDLGLAVMHVHDSRRCWLPGWPDLVILGSSVLYRELKSRDGQLSIDQRWVGSRLTRAGADWAVWRPGDLLDGTIAQTLARVAPR